LAWGIRRLQAPGIDREYEPILGVGIRRCKLAQDFDTVTMFHFVFWAIRSVIFLLAGFWGVFFSCTASLSSNGSLTPAGLTSVAVGHAFALFAAVTVAANVSGGHVNPAVTFALFLGGRIGFASGLSYWIAQIVGSIAACSILAFIVTDVVRSLSESL
jgi:glycerol uptake facilitator-like aquaporin